jgi:hypothetical protein
MSTKQIWIVVILVRVLRRGVEEAHKHYPCVKRAWVEYLGEPPEPGLDRVETSPV